MAIRSRASFLEGKTKMMIELAASGFLMTTKQMRTEAIIGLPWWRLLTINYISNNKTTWLFPLQLMLLLLHFLTSPRYTSNYNLRQALFYLSLIHICNFGFVRWCVPNVGLTQILHKHSFITCIHLLGLDYYLLYTRYLGNSFPIILLL